MKRRARFSPHDRGAVSRIVARASFIMRENRTPEGHAVSQALHSRQRFMWRAKVGLVGAMRPSSIAFIRYMRPRGESTSLPSSR